MAGQWRAAAMLACLAAVNVGYAGEDRYADAPVRALPEAARRIDLATFTQTFHDEFDGDRLNTDIWTAPVHDRQGASRWRGRNVEVHDGSLWIKVKLTDDKTFRYETAGLRTAKNYDMENAAFSQTFGYWEIRARLFKELKADYWAAFWLLSGNVYKTKDADTREGVEIDIMESFHFSDRGRLGHPMHWGSYGEYHNAGGPASGRHPELTDGEMHTYGLYWDEDIYAFCIDGKVVAVTDAIGYGTDKDPKKTVSKGTSRRPAIAKISVEAAPWAGPTSAWEKEMPKEDVFEVDYIRVYQGRVAPATKAKWMEHLQRGPNAAVADAALKAESASR